MEKIAIITDSSCDLSEQDRIDNNIFMLPLRVIYKEREYLDKIEISAEQMYARLKEEAPTTSLPDIDYSKKLFKKIIDQGYTKAIIITISIALSGTNNCVRILCQEFENVMEFSFFDTKTLGYPVGAIALAAAKLLQQGKSYDEIVDRLPDIRSRVKGFIAVDTLEYLIRGGRISRVTGTVGELLHLKPIISHNEDGLLYNYANIRGKKKSLIKIREVLTEFLDKYKCRIWILQGDAIEEGKKFFDDMKNHPNITEISLETIGAAMGVHTGPGVIGFTVLFEK